jgi:hypothetical protein
MDKKQEILDELRQISPKLAETAMLTPYRVPPGYFDALPVLVMTRLEQEAQLPAIQDMAYSLPDGYFESLAGNILEKIRKQENPLHEVQAELQEVAPLLNTISRTNIYSVPEGYFDTISFVPAAKPAKVINLRFAKKWTQYATAAVLGGILVTGGFLFTDRNNTNNSTYSRMDVSGELDKVSETDLSAYLSNPESPDVDAVAEVKNNINSMSDEELDQYLSENQDMDMIISVSN